MVYDTDSGGFGGPADMSGPQIGLSAYSEPGNNLRVKLSVEFGQPNTKYEVFLVGGPSHATGTGFVTIGTLATNAAGAGTGSFVVPHARLLAAPFGPGYRTDHIDLMKGVGDLSRGLLTAGAINYFVCREPSALAAGEEPLPEAHVGAVHKGDPCGDKVGHQ